MKNKKWKHFTFRFLKGLCLMLLILFKANQFTQAQPSVNEQRVMMQAFYWDCYNESGQGNWWDYIRPKMQSLATSGFTEIWLPVANRGVNNPSMGYDPYDYYDLGQYPQFVGPSTDTKTPTETYFGSKTELLNLISTMHTNGIKAYADMVFNHCTGGALENNPNTGGQTPTNFTPMSGKYQFHYNDFHPSTYESSDEGTFSTYPDICHANPEVMTILEKYQRWLIDSIGYDGFRYDWVNGYHPWVIQQLQTAHGKFGVTEYWDQNKSNCLTYLTNINYTSNTFDFPLFYALHDMCNNGGGYDMTQLFTAGVVSSQPDYAVTFAQNHDTNKESAYVLTSGQEMLAYAYILTHKGLPMVFYKDYFNNGLAKTGTPNGIDQLIWVRKHFATGACNLLYSDADLYVMQRGDPGTTTGLVFGLNDNSSTIKTATIQTKWINTVMKAYAWGSSVSSSTPACILTDANGNMTISVNARGYVVYAPSDGLSYPVSCSLVPPASAPTFSPVAGMYTSAQTVSITSATSGAAIYYTTDGTVPTTSSKLYSGSIAVSSSLTINAIAVKAGLDNSSVSSAAYSIVQPIPTPWLRTDVGSVTPAGSAYYNPTGSQFINNGAGADIYGTADAFSYIYQAVTGDVTIIAKVISISNTNAWAKSGVMIRGSVNANAMNAFMALTPSSGSTFQIRTSDGGATTTTESSGIAAPYWVKLQRSGNTFSGYMSTDGVTWTQVGSSTTISMASSVQIGLASTSHADGTLCSAVFSNVQIVTTGTVLVTGVTVSPTSASINVGATQQLTATIAPTNATNKNVTWTTGNSSIASVSTSGLVTGVAAGTANITVTTADGAKTATSVITVNTTTIIPTGVTVTPTSATITVAGTQQLTATVAPTNATNKSVTWTSSNSAIATISTSGLVTGIASGSATITVTTVSGSKTATSVITVSTTTIIPTGVTVTPTSATISVSGTQQLTATIAPTNATNKNVTWATSNSAIATVSTGGLVTGIASGSATITVTTVSGSKTATSAITVTSTVVTPTSVTVSPTSASISVAGTQQLTATVAPTNATNKNVTWATSNSAIATVSTGGLVTGVSSGSATITVTTVSGSKTATSAVTVSSSSGQTAMYVAGTFNSWTLTSMIKVSTYVWKISGVAISAGAQQLKFANTSNWTGIDWGNASGLSGTAAVTTGGGANLSFTAPYSTTYTINFNTSTLSYSIVNDYMAINSQMYVAGDFSGWDPTQHPMTLTANYTWSSTNISLTTGSHTMKYANTTNWSGVDWGNASGLTGTAKITTGNGPNLSFSITTAGNYIMTFNDQTLAYSIAVSTKSSGERADFEKDDFNKIMLYPNPVSDVLNIDLGNSNNATIEAYDLTGRLIFKKIVYQSLNTLEIQDLNFKGSLMIVRVTTSTQLSVFKVMIK
jgi:alpha-amylase